jgi:hypothetical protein
MAALCCLRRAGYRGYARSHKRLPKWNYQGAELALWHRDQQINDRGVCMDVQLAQAAIEAVDLEQKRLAKRTQVMTDGEVQAATQRDALIKHIVESYGWSCRTCSAARWSAVWLILICRRGERAAGYPPAGQHHQHQ